MKTLGCAVLLVVFTFVFAALIVLSGVLNAGALVWEIMRGESR